MLWISGKDFVDIFVPRAGRDRPCPQAGDHVSVAESWAELVPLGPVILGG